MGRRFAIFPTLFKVTDNYILEIVQDSDVVAAGH